MRLIDADALLENLPVHPDGGLRSIGEESLMLRVRQTIASAPTVDGWISVDDRLPEPILNHQTIKDGKVHETDNAIQM